MWNDGDGQGGSFNSGNSEADPFHGNRPLVNDVLGYLMRNFDVQPEVLRAFYGLESKEFTGTVHVTLHNVSTHASVSLHWQFEIHERTFANPRERCTFPSLRGKVGSERNSWLDVHGG